MNICALSQLDFTDSGRRTSDPPHSPRVTLVGARCAISAQDAKANNNKAKKIQNNNANNKKNDNNDNMGNPKKTTWTTKKVPYEHP